MDIIAVIDHLSIDIGKLNTIDDCNIDLGDIYHPEKLRLMIHINMLRCSIRYKIVRVNGCFVHITASSGVHSGLASGYNTLWQFTYGKIWILTHLIIIIGLSTAYI